MYLLGWQIKGWKKEAIARLMVDQTKNFRGESILGLVHPKIEHSAKETFLASRFHARFPMWFQNPWRTPPRPIPPLSCRSCGRSSSRSSSSDISKLQLGKSLEVRSSIYLHILILYLSLQAQYSSQSTRRAIVWWFLYQLSKEMQNAKELRILLKVRATTYSSEHTKSKEWAIRGADT